MERGLTLTDNEIKECIAGLHALAENRTIAVDGDPNYPDTTPSMRSARRKLTEALGCPRKHPVARRGR